MKAAQSVSVSESDLPVDHPELRRVQPGDAGDHAYYELFYCPQRHYLQMRLVGTWDAAIFARYSQCYLAVMNELAAAGGLTHALVDASQFEVQTSEIAEAFPDLVRSAPHRPEQRTACIVQTVVTRVQARPGGDVINARYFRTKDDAVYWLFSDEA